MRPLRALYIALAICYTAQARLSRSRSSRVHHSTMHHATMHHATMHHPITAGHTPHTSKALEALHKQREKKQAEAEAARRNATAKQPPPQAPKPAPRKPPPPRQAPPPRLSPTVVARAEATSCWLHVSGLHHSGTGVLRMLIARNPLASIQSWSNSRFVEHESQWAQHSYPAFAARTNATCPPGSAAAAYTCPQLQALATPSTRHAIAKEWLAAHREPTKPILVQKNPTLDIGFLEHLFPRTAHALVMRHPFHWRIGLRTHCNHSAACRFDVWRAVWKETFEVLPTIRRYFVVQYEALPGFEAQVTAFAGRLCGGAPRRRLYLTGTDVHYDGAEASKYDAVWASADRASLTPWESFMRGTFGYSLLHRENASADVRTGRFLATSLEPVVGGLEWVPRPYVRRA